MEIMKLKRSKQHRTGTGTGQTDTGNGTDISAVVKAAAWAWYQHGSVSEGKEMREYDVTRIYHSPTPSRYKLEAIRNIGKESSEGYSSISTTPTSCIHVDRISNSDLLDTYEIESISRKLDGLIIESSCVKDHVSAVDNNNDNNKERKKKKKKLMMMMRGLSHAAVVCGTREDVVESTRAAFDGRRRPEKRVVPVVRISNCRPRATHAR